MANPLTVSITKNTWQKVATAVVTGMIYKRLSVLPTRQEKAPAVLPARLRQ